MDFDLSNVPFSRYGSRFSIRRFTHLDNAPGEISLSFIPRHIFRLDVMKDGLPVTPAVHATPQMLVLTAGDGRVDIVFESTERLRIRVQGLTLKLLADGGGFNYCLPRGERRWQVNLFPTNHNFLLTSLHGALAVDAPWHTTCAEYIDVRLDGEGGSAEAALEYFTTTAPGEEITAPFTEVLARSPEGFADFLAGLAAAPEEFQPARELAGYVLWSAALTPKGHLQRDTILMSKNHMTRVWSWDNCFNAMALAAGHPRLAWDQLMVIFDQQDADGCLPDSVTQEEIAWNFCKPPVHGWALVKMLDANPALAEQLPEIYDRLERWTDWWLRERDDDSDGMPQYNHGNDSGWDNATCFDLLPPLEGPDLAAFLITQMDALAEVARRLGKPEEAVRWQERADRLQHTLLAHSWDGARFRARRSGTHETPSSGDSLIPFMPLLLGERLPEEIRATLIAGLREPGRFITTWGPATESPRSSLYASDGYWRGPIWAPSTYLLYDGLLRCGERDLARDIARRFCRLCAGSGMAENFDALTGDPLRDTAYTWTASVFLLLAQDLLDE